MTASQGQALEAALLAHPDDLGAHAAYADWLIEQGDPRGEFIQVQLALEDESKPAKERQALQEREKDLLAKHQEEWTGPWSGLAAVGTPEGRGQLDFPAAAPYAFVRGLLTDITIGELSEECARALVKSAQTRTVRRLFIGGWGYDEDYEEPARNVLPEWPYFANLRAFQFGWTSDEVYGDFCDFQCHLSGENIHELVQRMPNLEELYLFAHRVNASAFVALPMSRLRVFQLYHSYDYPLQELAENESLTQLTHLLCHPHALDQDEAYIRLPGLRAIVRSPHLKSMRHLRLRLADFGDEGCEEIVKSGVLRRLETLDLRHGRISDAGAKILVSSPDLKRLKSLDLSRNELTQDGIDLLQSVGIPVAVEHQHASTAGMDPTSYEATQYLYEADYE